MALLKELRRRREEIARPLVSGVQPEGANAHGTLPKTLFIIGELLFRIPSVRCPAGNERRRHPLQCTGRDLRRNVATDRNDTSNAVIRINGCAKSHPNSLRESGEHDRR